MESEQRIQALEQEVQILKNQIQAILLDIQSHLLTNTYPTLRGDSGHSSERSQASSDDSIEDDQRGLNINKPSPNGTASKKPKKTEARPVVRKTTVAQKAVVSDEHAQWVMQQVNELGAHETYDLIRSYMDNQEIAHDVGEALLELVTFYAPEETPTLPSRPAGMQLPPVATFQAQPARPQPVRQPPARQQPQVQQPVRQQPVRQQPQMQQPVRQQPQVQQPVRQQPVRQQPVRQQPGQQNVSRVQANQRPQTPYSNGTNGHHPMNEPTPAQPPERVEQVLEDAPHEVGKTSLVLRLIAGVQNAGAGVRWGKNNNG